RDKMGSRVFALFITGVALLGSRILALDHTVVEKRLNENTVSLTTKGSPQLCQLCEQFAAETLFYLKENETRIEIIDTLHQACLKFHSLKLECTKLVDYYAALFFAQIDSLSPEEFCVSASLCEEVTYIRLPGHEHACTLCHEVVDEIRTGLEDPEMELKIIEILLKGCNNTESFVQKCKKMIIQNTPVILEDIKKFLKKRDFCDSIRVCGGKIVRPRGGGLRGLSTA
uniref:Saposin B-type domain-containing protein n=3 Tax=Aegilops tauschii TaxID=37682 RepID=A0A452ZQE4_AEGTS